MKSLLLLAILAQDPDAKKTAQQLFTEGQRLESVDRDFAKAADKYRKSAEKAKAEGTKALEAKALHNLGRCCENQDPENISGALEAWNRIVSDCGDVEPYAGLAKKKAEWAGVDVWLRQYKAVLDKWRETRGNQAAVTAARDAVWVKISALEVKAVPGLLEGLSSEDEVLRAFAADCLAQLTDSDGLAKIIAKLKDPNPVARGGASLTLEKCFQVWREAKLFDDQAAAMRRDFDLAKLGASSGSDIDGELKAAADAVAEAQKALAEAKSAAGSAPAAEKENAESRVRLAESRLKQAEDHLSVLKNVKSTHDRAADLEARAAKIRRSIPKELNDPAIQTALAEIIQDETAHHTARVEAARAAQGIGDISEKLTDAIIAGMKSKNRNVRVGCVRAASAVSTAQSKDKHRLVDVLMELVQLEPEKDWNPPVISAEEEKQIRTAVDKLLTAKDEEAEGIHRSLISEWGDRAEDVLRRVIAQASGKIRERLDRVLLELRDRRWANDPLVRQSAAQSLGKIALVKSVPSLFEALEDNDAGVRRESNEALMAITRMNFGYESEPRIPDPEHKLDDSARRAEQAKLRLEAIKKWKEWWASSGGVDILIERYWTFQQRWTAFDAADLFDREYFVRQVVSSSSPASRKWDEERAGRIYEGFQKEKDVFVMDAVDLGEAALDRLYERLNGQSRQEEIFANLGTERKERLVAKSRAATRLFVAECIAKLALKTNSASAVAGKLAGMLGDDKGAGAASALGFLGKEGAADAKGALESTGLTASSEATQEASALALLRIGGDSSAEGLTRLAVAGAQDPSVDSPRVRASIAALRALATLKPRNAQTVQALGDLVGHEPEDASSASKRAASELVREFACEALGKIGDPSAATSLLRARRDTKRNVRDAAAGAIREIFKVDASISRKLLEVLRDEKASSLDRIGAALAIGDTGHEPRVHDLIARLLDPNPPTLLKDQDPAVRAAICRALGAIHAQLKENNRKPTQLAIESLFSGMEDPAEEVRQEAYDALRIAVGADVAAQHTVPVLEIKGSNPVPQEFKGWYTNETREKFLKLWRTWYESKKSDFEKEPPKET